MELLKGARAGTAAQPCSTRPKKSPPIMAPGREPMPPMTAAVKASMPGMEPTVYGDVKADVVEQIINTHLVGKAVLKDLVLEKPSIDIIKEG